MLAMFGLPLSRTLQSQTQFCTRLRLFLAAISTNAVHPTFALQLTIDTICGGARVLEFGAAFSRAGVAGCVGVLVRAGGTSPSGVSLAARLGIPN